MLVLYDETDETAERLAKALRGYPFIVLPIQKIPQEKREGVEGGEEDFGAVISVPRMEGRGPLCTSQRFLGSMAPEWARKARVLLGIRTSATISEATVIAAVGHLENHLSPTRSTFLLQGSS